MYISLFMLAMSPAADPPTGFPKFETQEIAKDLKIGYAVITADVNGDGKPDIVVVDKERVIWFENPTWKMRTIITGKTKPDNVCIAAADIDGDGQIDFVLGAGWRPNDTTTPGTLQWLSRGKTLDEEWTVHPIPCDEPTVHRVKVVHEIANNGLQIIVAPLQGRGATAKGNWTDGRTVRIVSYHVPKEPEKSESWKPTVINENLHVVHNLEIKSEIRNFKDGSKATYSDFFLASYEGVTHLHQSHGRIQFDVPVRNRSGDQSNPRSNRGSSEISAILNAGGLYSHWVTTVEPWHGNQIVFYLDTDPGVSNQEPKRMVLDSNLRWGHAIKFADLNGEKNPMIVAGVRDNPNPKLGDTFTEKCGVRLYRNTDGKGEKWDRMLLDEGGVAVEDLVVADLNGDGKPDIVAVGRATGNCRIYWNNSKP